MSLFGNLFGHYKDPSKAAMPYINQIPGVAHEAFDPYVNRGQQAGASLSPLYERLMNDPSGYYNDMMKNYKPSEGFALKQKEALGAAGNTAAAGGYRGSQADMINATNISNRLMGDDMQQWWNNLMGLQNTGIAGQQGMYNTGFNASTNLSGDVSNALGQKAQYAAQGVQGKNNYNQAMMDAFLKFLGQGAGAAAQVYNGGMPAA